VNAIPSVCTAPQGMLSALDLPLVTGRGLYAQSTAGNGLSGFAKK